MSISFSGLGSGLPIDEWITKLVAVEQAKVDTLNTQRETITKKQSALNTLKSEYNAVQTAASKFTDCLFGAGMDFFSKVGVKVSGTDKDNPAVTATVTQYSTPSSLEVYVDKLATSASMKSMQFNVLKNSSNKLSELGVTSEGSFQINGATINVKPDMTIDSLVYQINNSAQAGVKASLKKGRLVLENKETGAKNITITATGSVTSNNKNFAELLGFSSPGSASSRVYDAGYMLDPSTSLGAFGVGQSGYVTINGTRISVSSSDTMRTFMNNVNNSAANVTLSLSDGRYVLESKNGSHEPIRLGGSVVNPSNQGTLFETMGFENTTTKGQDAVFYINGDRKTSSSNTITSETSGILGLSMVLNSTGGSSSDPIVLDISRDYDSEAPFEAIQSFVDAFNKMIVDSKASTDSENGGLLSGENTLNNLRTNLRSMITSPVSNSGIYRSLADIGITTGAPGLDVDADTTQLIIDKDKFMEAFKKDPNSVKALLIGDTEDGIGKGNGLMQQVQESLTPALDSKYGYFSARTESFEAQLKNMDEKIEKKKEYVTRYQEKLTKQFTYMDNLIAQMNNQFSQMQQQLASIGVDVGGSSS